MQQGINELPPLPPRMRKLPRWRIMGMDAPVPWFVKWLKGGKEANPGEDGAEPDFRVMDGSKWLKTVRHGNCWVCGEPTGRHKAWVIGPMCAVNRVTSEPACHLDCAIFSAKACPFMTRPKMRRNEKGLPEDAAEAAGFALKRNPGVTCIWVGTSFRLFKAQAGASGYLIQLDDPTDVLWFAGGQPATRAQVMESISSGYPALEQMALEDGSDAIIALARSRDRAMQYLPAA